MYRLAQIGWKMEEKEYLNSKESKAILKVQDCDLMHIRISGKLNFVKKGNAFMYSKESIEQFVKEERMTK